MRNGSVGTNSFEKIVVTVYTIRCGITVQMLACAACLCVYYDSYSKQRLFQCTSLTDGLSYRRLSLFTARLGSEILRLAPKSNILCLLADADIFTVCDVLGTTRSS